MRSPESSTVGATRRALGARVLPDQRGLRGLLAGLALATGLLAGAGATEAQPASADPVLEARVMRLAAELRCLVCQNQTIAESHADLAVDLRNQVRNMLHQGRSEEDVLAYMTQRYGDFVLYRPPLKSTTLLLWFGPAVLLVGGLATLGLILLRRRRLGAEAFEPDMDDDNDGPPAPEATAPVPRARTE